MAHGCNHLPPEKNDCTIFSSHQLHFYFWKLPPKYDIFPQLIVSCRSKYYLLWMNWSTFVQYAVEQYTHTLLFVNVVKKKYIKTVLHCHKMISYISKVAELGSEDYAMKEYFHLIIKNLITSLQWHSISLWVMHWYRGLNFNPRTQWFFIHLISMKWKIR